ncbi:MAG: hypothetical protein ACREEM_22830, partial [Blastocatellia bacterium]
AQGGMERSGMEPWAGAATTHSAHGCGRQRMNDRASEKIVVRGWMNVTEYLNKQGKAVKQVVFDGEPFTARSVWRMRDHLFQ